MMGVERLNRLMTSLAAGAAAAALLAGSAWAQTAAQVSTPAQPLKAALEQVARQTGADILFTPDVVQGVTAPALSGQYTPEDAVRRLLAGSSLEVIRDSSGALIVRRRGAAPASPAAETPAEEAFIGEVVVTARRREESVQRVPIAVTVIGGEQIEATGARNLSDISRQAPSLQVYTTNPRNTTLNIRGVGNNIGQANIGLEQGVGFYLDQVYYSRPGQAMFDLVDIDQIEVLRGPQGTLFGKNTTGGALNVSTKLPSATPEASGQISLGNHEYYQIRGSASGPITDQLRGRIAFSVGHREGDIENVRTGDKYNGFGSELLRGQLVYTPNDNLTVRVIGDYAHYRTSQNLLVLGQVVTTRADGSPLPNNFFARAARLGYTPLPLDPYSHQTDADSIISQKMKTGGGSAQIDWDLGGNLLTSITAYRVWNFIPFSDIDQTALPVLVRAGQVEHHKQFTQELRLASTGERKLDYVVGLYYFWQRTKAENAVQYGPATASWLFGAAVPGIPSLVLDGYTSSYVTIPETSSVAGFGQGTWHATDRLNVTLGLRYTHERKSGDFNQTVSGGASLAGLPAIYQTLRNGVAAPLFYAARTSESDVSGRLDAAYQVTPDVLAYAAYSKGYKSGGINLTTIPPNVPVVLDPEKVDAYELGLKSAWFDRRLVVNLAAFWQDVRDYQASEILPGTTTVYLANVPKARSRGVELDTQARPMRGLSLYGAASYTDAVTVSYVNGTCGIEYTGLRTACDQSGRPIPGVSKWAASAGGEYSRPFTYGSGEAEAYLNVDYSYRSSFYSQPTLSAYSLIKGYGLVGLRAGVRAADERWNVAVWAKNVFDKDYFTLTNPNLIGNSGAVGYFPGDPRTVGITLSARY